MPDIVRLKEQARLFFQKGEWDKARRAVEQVLMFESENTEFNLILADIFLETADARRGLDQLEKVLRISEKSQDHGRGIVACRKILSIDRERIELYNKSGDLYYRLGLKSGAIREWLKYIDQLKLRQDYTAINAAYQKISGILPENQILKDLAARVRSIAEQLLSDTSENAPEPADIAPYRRLVEVALKMGQPKKIIETQLSYARVLQRRGLLKKAKTVYQKILERDPANEEALSKVLMLRDNTDLDQTQLREDFFEAGRQFQEAIWSKVEEQYELYYELAVLFRYHGLRDDAIIELQQAIKGGGRQLKAFEMLAMSFLEQGDFGLAKEVLHQGLSIKKFLDNEYVGLHYNLGLAHEQMGDLAKAVSEYEQVYIIDITYKDVAYRLRRLEAQLKAQTPAPASVQAPAATQPAPKPASPSQITSPAVPAPKEAEPEPVSPEPPAAEISSQKSAVAIPQPAAPASVASTAIPEPRAEQTAPISEQPAAMPAASQEPAEVTSQTEASGENMAEVQEQAEPQAEETVAKEEPEPDNVYLKEQGLSFL